MLKEAGDNIHPGHPKYPLRKVAKVMESLENILPETSELAYLAYMAERLAFCRELLKKIKKFLTKPRIVEYCSLGVWKRNIKQIWRSSP